MGLPRFQPQDRPADTDLAPRSTGTNYLRAIFILACFVILHWARAVFVPLVLGLLLALVLLPLVRSLSKWRIPPALGSIVVLLAFLGLLSLAGMLLAAPARSWARRAPEVFESVTKRMAPVTRPFREMQAKLHASTPNAGADGRRPEWPVPAETSHSDVIRNVLTHTGDFVTVAGTTFILLYFLLASGDGLLRSCVVEIPNRTDREAVGLIGHQVQQHISKYFLALTAINVVEGILISAGLAMAGMPTPAVWGALHAVLNFIPYIGSITGLAITAAVSLISFPTIPRALIAPAIYLGVMVLDNFVSPLVLGRRLALNPALVFISLMFWGWIWGIVGVLVAVPILVVFKIVCEHVPALQSYGRILSSGSPSAGINKR